MRLSIKVRFRALLAVCAALTALLVVGLVHTGRVLDRDFAALSDRAVPALLEAQQLRGRFDRLAMGTDAILLARDPGRIVGRTRELDAFEADLRRIAGRPGASPRLASAVVEFGAFDSATHALLLRDFGMPLPPLLRETWGGATRETLDAAAREVSARLRHDLDEFVTERERVVAERLADVQRGQHRQAYAISLAAVVALATLFGWLLAQTRSITRPLDALARVARGAARGNLEQGFDVTAVRDDEVGDLVRAFEEMRTGLRESTMSRQQVDRILSCMPDLVVVCDPDVRIRALNPAAEALLGRGQRETFGRLLVEYVSPSYRSTFRSCVRALSREDSFENTEIEFQRAYGDGVLVRMSAATLTNASGGFDGYVFSGADFTQWKRIEQELLQAKIAAEDGTRAKSAFLATMSHEIRTPMTAVLGYAENLMDPGIPEAERIEAARTIHANGEHLIDLINSILDLSKIEAGRLDVERVDADPVEIVQQACDLLRGPAGAKGLTLEFGCTGEMPIRIRTDPVRLRQILVNLIGNAIKFTDAGGIRVQVALDPRERQAAPQLNVLVVDTGIGMSAEALGRVFSPFTQADDSMSRRYGGTGLGLAISRHLAQLLGGDIVVHSHPDNGSAFRVTVATGPLDGVLMRPAGTGQRAAAPAGPAKSGADAAPPLDARILVVEDNEVNLRLISHILARAGAVVEAAGNGQEGVAAVQRAAGAGQPFDAVLMDIQMPLMDGLTATRVLRRCGHRVPIVALTANAMASDRDACLAAGCDDFATKPIQRRELLAKLARLTSAKAGDGVAAAVSPGAGERPRRG